MSDYRVELVYSAQDEHTHAADLRGALERAFPTAEVREEKATRLLITVRGRQAGEVEPTIQAVAMAAGFDPKRITPVTNWSKDDHANPPVAADDTPPQRDIHAGEGGQRSGSIDPDLLIGNKPPVNFDELAAEREEQASKDKDARSAQARTASTDTNANTNAKPAPKRGG